MSCTLALPDYKTLATVSDDVSIPSGISVVQSPEAGTVISGPQITVVTLTATDESGKSSSCNFTVIGTDRLAPVITGTPENILASTGEESADCSAEVSWTEPTASDNCTTPLTYFNRTHIPGAAFAVGTTQVTYTFRDEAGNEDSTSFTIVVVDDTKPVVITRNITRSLADGAATITAEDVNNGSWDNCGIYSLTVSTANFTCADIGENIVTLTAVDVHGNENTATAIVTITGSIPAPFVTISRENNIFTGLPDNTIALGYGAQALTLSVNAEVSSETDYAWSPATGLSTTNGPFTVFTPSGEGNYTFTVDVTNEYGCSATTQVTVRVIDVRCGNKGRKVQLCRTIGNHSVELCVAPQAVAILLKTGAKLGSCQWTETPEEMPQTSVLMAYPNPFEQHLDLQFKLPVSDTHVRLDIYDVFGGKLMRVFEGPTEAGQVQNFSLSANELRGRIFLVRLLTSSGKSYYIKVVRQD
jgi:hypothetical protein